MRISLCLTMFTLLPALPVAAQFFFPASASTRLHFAQFADGGSASQKWTTTLLLADPDPLRAASLSLEFFDNNGQPLPVDFGSGPSATLDLSLPAGGTRTLTSTGAPGTTVVGWARLTSNAPVYGTVIYRASSGGVPVWDVAAPGTSDTYSYSSQAAYSLGVALANPYLGVGTIHLRVSTRDQNGVSGNYLDAALPPLGHTSFNLGAAVTGLAPSFAGTISIVSTDNPPLPFVAWTLFERDGLLSPLPPGGMRFPADNTRLPKDTLAFLKSGAVTLVQALRPEDFTTPPATVIQLVRQKGLVLEASGTLKATYENVG